MQIRVEDCKRAVKLVQDVLGAKFLTLADVTTKEQLDAVLRKHKAVCTLKSAQG